MADIYYQFRNPKVKKVQMVYLGYKFGKSQILYPTGVRLNPSQWNFDTKTVRNVAFLEGDIKKANMPTVDENFKFNYDYVKGILDFLTTKVNTFTHNNLEPITKESLRAFIDSLYNAKDKDLSEFVNKLSSELFGLLIDNSKKKKNISKLDLIEYAIKYLENEKPTNSFFDYLDNYISDAEVGKRLNGSKKYSFRTIQRFKTTRAILEKFEIWNGTKITFEKIDKAFEQKFNNYMTEKEDYQPNTMGKHTAILKKFLKEALYEDVHNNVKFQSFKVSTVDSYHIALRPSEISEMYQLDLSKNKNLEIVRDMFVLSCHSGLRWSDFTEIKPENIKHGDNGLLIDMIQDKTKTQVIIPANVVITEILAKYKNQFPEPVTNQEFNRAIKDVGKMIPSLEKIENYMLIKGGIETEKQEPRWNLISSHTGRRSFATNAFEKGIETKLIRAITTHKTDKSFYKYIKTDAIKLAEMFREKNI